VDSATRKRWIASHILPLEAQARRWLTRHVRSLSTSDTDDLIQESYFRIWSGADLSAIQTPATYLYVVLRNLLVQQARHARIVPMDRMGEIDELSIPSGEPSEDRRIAAHQELERVSRVVEALPEQCRRVFELRKVHGLSQREVAAELDISERTVEKHLAKALARVMEMRRREEAIESGQNVSTAKIDGHRTERD
jgi:RNA polymerase sigma factor (sigma-70 family)